MDTEMTMDEVSPKGNNSKRHWLSMGGIGIYLFILIIGLVITTLSDYLSYLCSGRYFGISVFARDLCSGWPMLLFDSMIPALAAMLSAFLLRKCSPVFRFFPMVAAYSLIVFVNLVTPRDTGPGLFIYFVFLPCIIPAVIAALSIIFFIGDCISRRLQAKLQKA